MPHVLLVRHGRTSANASGTLAGWTDGVGLDDTGRAQVHALAERLRDVPVVVLASSPLQRCQETIDLLVEGAPWAQAARRVADDDLGECHYGSWTGRSLRELATEDLWRTVQDQPSRAQFPDSPDYRAESIAAMSARAVAAARRIDAEVEAEHGPHAVWLLVSHGDIIKALLADAAGTHLDHFQRFQAGPASLSVVHYTDRRPFLVRANDTGSDLSTLLPRPPAEGAGGGAGAGAGGDASGGDAPSGDAVVGGGAA